MLLVVAAVAAMAIGGVASSGAVASVPPPDDASAPAVSSDGTDPALAALNDVLAWLADPTSIDMTRFTDAFVAMIPADQLEQAFVSIGVGVWEAVDVDHPIPGGVAARLEGPGPPLTVQLVVDGSGRIDGLLFQPVELVDPPDDLTGLVRRLESTAPVAGFLRADIAADGSCTPVAQLRHNELLPIASAFKLYVLGAVAAMIGAGELTWDQPIEIRDDLDSLPSGVTQDEPAGTMLTVRELALRMIEISDNTATDHLVDLVGRGRVEHSLVTMGHHDPTATRPMLTTREMFVVKTDPDLVARFESASEDERRALLAGPVAAAPLPDVAEFPNVPVAVTTVEWFASPMDACNALVALDDMATTPGLEPIREILSANAGIPPPTGTFSRVLFKGGSEPGVLFVAWLAARPDGSRVVVTGGVADPAAGVDQRAAELIALGLTLD